MLSAIALLIKDRFVDRTEKILVGRVTNKNFCLWRLVRRKTEIFVPENVL